MASRALSRVAKKALRMPSRMRPASVSSTVRPRRSKSRAELPLQLADVLGQGRLAEMKRLRRATKAFRARDGQEHLELPE
jgi:hypothetical protein